MNFPQRVGTFGANFFYPPKKEELLKSTGTLGVGLTALNFSNWSKVLAALHLNHQSKINKMQLQIN